MEYSLTIEEAVGQRILLAFGGKDEIPADMMDAIRRQKIAGVTLKRRKNIVSPFQVRDLTEKLQQIAREAGVPPLIIGSDYDNWQSGPFCDGVTQLPGSLALGAAGSPELAFKAGQVWGSELAAMGINLNYAPYCNLMTFPQNLVSGELAFSDDRDLAAALMKPFVMGIQSSGVATAARVNPVNGLGEAPGLYGENGMPAAYSKNNKLELLFGELGWKDVTMFDAMGMQTNSQGIDLGEEFARKADGIDLLLVDEGLENQRAAYRGILNSMQSAKTAQAELFGSARRVLALKNWLKNCNHQPELNVVGSPEHQSVANEIAYGSVTLVKDDAHLIPIPLAPSDPVAVLWPRPRDPDSTSPGYYPRPALARELRRLHPAISEFSIRHDPSREEIAGMVNCAHDFKLIIVGTINACMQPEQAEMVRALLCSGVPTIVAAMGLPIDLAYFPEAPTYLCLYSILEPSMQVLARVLAGESKAQGHLPVNITDLYLRGSGIVD